MNTQLKDLFLNESTLKEHLEKQETNIQEYIDCMTQLTEKYGIEFSIIKKARILAVAMMRNDKNLSTYLLNTYKYELPDIMKTCQILDSRRFSNQLTKRLEKFKNKNKISKTKSLISNLKTLHEDTNASLSKSRVNFIKNNWLKKQTAQNLEDIALQYPTELWKRLIDLLHPKETDFQLPWFSSYVFNNEEYPMESKLYQCAHMNKDNVLETAKKYKLKYSYLKNNFPDLIKDNEELKYSICTYSSLNEIITNLDDLMINSCLSQLLSRIDKDELKIPYGELVKRIQLIDDLICKNQIDNKVDKELIISLYKKLTDIAHKKLGEYNINIEKPIVVFGDASASMDIAIRTSGIIASILSTLFGAKLHLFRSEDQIIEKPPTNVEEVITMSKEYKANNCTAPAKSLYPYYQRKEIVKTFIMVTDEVENTGYEGGWGNKEKWFAPLFKKYREEVYPAKLVFVSFLPNNKDGQMVSHLKELIPEIEKDIIQFILDSKKPDLRKLDILLNKLMLESNVDDINEINQLYSKDEDEFVTIEI